MFMYGFYRFRHNVQGCYFRADKLTNMVCDHLKIQFSNVSEYLENVLKDEGIHGDDNICLGNTPFTTMCITKNYHCNIHTDADDVSYGFFIWFGHHNKYAIHHFYFFKCNLLCTFNYLHLLFLLNGLYFFYCD